MVLRKSYFKVIRNQILFFPIKHNYSFFQIRNISIKSFTTIPSETGSGSGPVFSKSMITPETIIFWAIDSIDCIKLL